MWKSRSDVKPEKKMAYQNTGSLSVNETKELPKHPDMRGPATIICPCCGEKSEFWVSGWFKIGRDGKRFLSLGFRPKPALDEQNNGLDGKQLQGMPMMREEDDGIPF